MQGFVRSLKSVVFQMQVVLLMGCMATGTLVVQAQEVPLSQFMALVYRNPEKQQLALDEIGAN